MKVFLMRHSRAVGEGPKLADEQRFLSGEGRRIARDVGKKLRAEGVELDAALTSPLVRAVQTAELFAQGIGYEGGIEAYFGLAPGVPPRVVAEEVTAHGVAVLVVGHEPGISALGAHLVGRPSFPPFRPGQVTLIEDGVARWSLSPDRLEIEPILVA
ncbi:MAG: histidine phosphatase family protein [Myxococcales bacterium]|nr:histidine phosphatase family protein [Myxococcales bacterium]